MRRHKQKLTQEQCVEILNRNTSGVLAVCKDDEFPYAVPLSYAYKDHCLYFHSAKQGHKIDFIIHNDKVSFCVIDQDEVVAKTYTTHYKSVIIQGNAAIIEDEKEKQKALIILCEKYCPLASEAEILNEYQKAVASLCMIKVEIHSMSGKQAKELVNQ